MVNIDYTLILVIVNFIVLLFILKKLLYKPLMDFINKRESQIRDDLQGAKELKEESTKILEKQKELLRKAKEEARSIRDEATKSAKIQSEQILHDSEKQRDVIIQEAQEIIDVEVNKAKESIQSQIGDFVIELTDKIIGKKLTEDDDVKLINDMIKEESKKKESSVD